MHHNTYNWYSTNSYRRYQKSVPRVQSEQYSDEGREPLGRPDDPENVAMQALVIGAASAEQLMEWEAFRKQQREGSLLARRRLGLRNEEVEEKYRTFPVKRHDWEAEASMEQQGGSDASQNMNEYRSRYVLNRKVNPRQQTPLTTSTPSPSTPSSSAMDDRIYIDDRDASSATNVRMIVSGDKVTTRIEKRVAECSILSPPPKKIREATSTVVIEKSVSPFVAPSTSSPSEPLRECVLAKYNHCFGPKFCAFEHNGKMTKVKDLNLTSPVWQQKLPTVERCPGYLDFSCWDDNCDLRHVSYPSDST